MDNLAVLIDFPFGLQPVFKFVAGFSASRLIKFIRAPRELILIGMIFPQSRLVFFVFVFHFLSFRFVVVISLFLVGKQTLRWTCRNRNTTLRRVDYTILLFFVVEEWFLEIQWQNGAR
jgi:hypothetical protein